jgi:glycerol-3-phosphate dehydrogenase
VGNRDAVTLVAPQDGRVMFVLPAATHTIIGTTETAARGGPDEVRATREEVRYLLEACNANFPAARLGDEDVVAAWSGIRPLAATLAEFGGAPAGALPGVSLTFAWSAGGGASPSPVIAEAAQAVNPGEYNLTRFGPIKASLDSTWHFIHYGNGREELFRWRADTAEMDDQARSAEGKATIERHRAIIAGALRTTWPPPRAGLH